MTEKRLVANEQKAALELHAIIGQINLSELNIAKRLDAIPRAHQRLRTARTLLTQIANEVVLTAPPEQRSHLSRQLPGLYMHIGVKDKIAQQKRDGEEGRLLSWRELDVVTSAIRECCRTCNITDPQQQKQCMYCKLLESLPTDKPDESATGCGYFTIW